MAAERASIRCCSGAEHGLWSVDSSTHLPRRLSTARQSPALATRRRRPSASATSAVLPEVSAGSSSCSRRSVRWNAWTWVTCGAVVASVATRGARRSRAGPSAATSEKKRWSRAATVRPPIRALGGREGVHYVRRRGARQRFSGPLRRSLLELGQHILHDAFAAKLGGAAPAVAVNPLGVTHGPRVADGAGRSLSARRACAPPLCPLLCVRAAAAAAAPPRPAKTRPAPPPSRTHGSAHRIDCGLRIRAERRGCRPWKRVQQDVAVLVCCARSLLLPVAAAESELEGVLRRAQRLRARGGGR